MSVYDLYPTAYTLVLAGLATAKPTFCATILGAARRVPGRQPRQVQPERTKWLHLSR